MLPFKQKVMLLMPCYKYLLTLNKLGYFIFKGEEVKVKTIVCELRFLSDIYDLIKQKKKNSIALFVFPSKDESFISSLKSSIYFQVYFSSFYSFLFILIPCIKINIQ